MAHLYRNGKQFFQWKQEKLLSFDKETSKMYISNRFAKYLSYLEVQKNSKVVNT